MTRGVVAVAVVAVLGVAAARASDDAPPAAVPTTSTTTSPVSAAGPEELADALFPEVPDPEGFRQVSERCAGNLAIEGGVPMEATGTHDHGTAELTAADLAFEERTAPDGTFERVFGGINPRVEVSTMPFDQQPTDDERAAAAAFVDEVAAVIDERGWEDPAQIIRDGFRPMQECNTHLVDVAAVLDGRELDPARPEFIVVEPGDDGQNHFHSVMFMVGSNAGHGPQPFGPLAVWHYHDTGGCMIEGVLVIPATSAECPAGTARYERTPEMLHVSVSATPFSPDM